MPSPAPDPNAPQPGAPIIISKWDGLKNTVNPERLSPSDLARARNIDLDDAKQASRRRGYTLKVSGRAHSPFQTFKGINLIVVNNALSILHPDYSLLTLQSNIGSDPADGGPGLAYAQVGSNVYFSCPTSKGIVDLHAKTAGAWGGVQDLWLSPVVNPSSTLPQVAGRLLGPPPFATGLAYFNGRIYMAVSKALWATDLYSYSWVDKTAGFKQFEAELTMVGAVKDGLYVGTEEGLWFLTGSNYQTMKRTRVMDSPVIAGSMVTIPGELGNPPQVPLGADTPTEVSLMFMTAAGVCIASDGGTTVNVTESKYWFPNAQSAAAMYRRQDGTNTYVAALQSGGDPVQEAKFGDYLSGTIIRGATKTVESL